MNKKTNIFAHTSLLIIGLLSFPGLEKAANAFSVEQTVQKLFPQAVKTTQESITISDKLGQRMRQASSAPLSLALRQLFLVRGLKADGEVVGYIYIDRFFIKGKKALLLVALKENGRIFYAKTLHYLGPKMFFPDQAFLKRFYGLTYDKIKQKTPSIDGITGASYTVREVKNSIFKILAFHGIRQP